MHQCYYVLDSIYIYPLTITKLNMHFHELQAIQYSKISSKIFRKVLMLKFQINPIKLLFQSKCLNIFSLGLSYIKRYSEIQFCII